MIRKAIFIFLFGIFFPNTGSERLITIGGCITDIVFDLGLGDKVIAVDISSVSPPSVKKLPQVGYIRGISAEGILSMMPSRILTTTDMGPPNVVSQIKKSGVDIHIFKSPSSFEDILSLVDEIANLYNIQERGSLLKQEMINYRDRILDIKSSYTYEPSIALFMNPAFGVYPAAGGNTRADYLINFIGGKNIFSEKFDKYRKVDKESIVALDPDIIIIGTTMGQDMTNFKAHIEGASEFKSISAVSSGMVFYIDIGDYLSFGSSFPDNAHSLVKEIKFDHKK